MLVRKKKVFYMGALLLISFAVMFWAMLMPWFSDGRGHKITSLQYADQVFNQLSKGSSWFVPRVREELAQLKGANINLTLNMREPELTSLAGRLLQRAGANVEGRDGKLRVSGDLAQVLGAATDDAALLYQNKGVEFISRYEVDDPLLVSRAWWQVLTPAVQELQKQRHNDWARMTDMVIKRALEPGNNFYGIRAENVRDNVLILCAFMLFYVLYTLWYGFAIYDIFDGLGLMASQTPAKEEMEEEREEGSGC